MVMARKTPQPRPITVYLRKEKREERIRALDTLANKFADGNLSKLMQMIADGELSVVPSKPDKQAS